MRIVYAFNDRNIINSIQEVLSDRDADYITCTSKMEVFYEVMNDDVDCVVIMENNAGDGAPWTAYEMARLTDFKDLNIIPIIKSEHLGLEFVKVLYAAGITSAVTDGSSIDDIAYLVKRKRNREEALEYYRLNDINDINKRYINVDTVPKDVLSEIDGALGSASGRNEMIRRFDDVCQELSQSQINDLLSKKISAERREIIRKSKTYRIINKTQKTKNDSGDVPEKFKRMNGHGKKIHILYAFDNDELRKYVDGKLTELDYDVYSNVEYTKKGIINYMRKHPDVDTVVTIEHLERKGPFTSEEIFEITKTSDANIIICVDSTRKGSEYMKQLYCDGVTSAFLGTPKTQKIIELIVSRRCRYEARKYYEIEQGHDEKFVLSDGIKKDTALFLEERSLNFESKVAFLEQIFNRTQINEIIQMSNDDVKKQAEQVGLINNKKKGIASVAPFLARDRKENADRSGETENKKLKRRIGEERVIANEDVPTETKENAGVGENPLTEVHDTSPGSETNAINAAKPESNRESVPDDTVSDESSNMEYGKQKKAQDGRQEKEDGDYQDNVIVHNVQKKAAVSPERQEHSVSGNAQRKPLIFDENDEARPVNKTKKFTGSIRLKKQYIIIIAAAVILLGGALTLAAGLRKGSQPISETMYNGENVVVQGGLVDDDDIEVDSQVATMSETESDVAVTTQNETSEEKATAEKTTKKAVKKSGGSSKSKDSEPEQTAGANGNASQSYSSTSANTSTRSNTTTKPKPKKTTKPKKTKPKPVSKPKPKPEKVINNTVPTQHQDTSELGYNGTQIIINTVSSAISGSMNTNMRNLAIYMAANDKNNAQSTINSLCENTTIKVTSKSATAIARSSAQKEVLAAAESLAKSLGGSAGKYGIGVKVTYTGGKFKVRVVVAIQTN